MAGYIMTLNSEDALVQCVRTGTYSTNMTEPRGGGWGRQQEGTFADYFSMKAGDSIYFFIKRKIYGIGRIVDVNYDCKFLNYIGADEPRVYEIENYEERRPILIYGGPQNRCFCTFEPDPHFFELGIDMDDALNSNPDKFKMLRAMWKVSFIKIGDEENQALQDIILKRNEENLVHEENIFDFEREFHNCLYERVSQEYRLNAYRVLFNSANGPLINHEMAIEAALCDILGKENVTPFGKWDYISHQVVASPFKAIDYMDKMDVFGYRYIPGYKTISRYLVIEIKKDVAEVEVISQIMKYVDWINQEYAHGDYSMIEAYIVAADFPEVVRQKRDVECVRNFTKGYRPTQACVWNYVKLIRYEYRAGQLVFTEV